MSKIHPPLPMTPQDSRKLLIQSKSSLQRHLDREYPEVMSHDRGRVRQHIQSVLDNLDTSLISGGSKPYHQVDGHVKSPSQFRRLFMRPMEHFKHEIAAGTATVKSARLCLTAQLELAQASPNRPLRLQSSGAASIVLDWMCNREKTVGLSLEELKLVKLMVKVVTTEGDKDMIWHGIKRMAENLGNDPSSLKGQRICSLGNFVITGLLRREIRLVGLISAVDFFVQGALEISSTNCRSHHILLLPGRFLMLQLIAYPSLIPTLQLNSFIKTLPAWSEMPRLHELVFKLHFPQCAGMGGVRAALEYLAGLDADGIVLQVKWQRWDVICLGLRVAELLLSSGSDHEAQWVMRFLQTNFPSELCKPNLKPLPQSAVRLQKAHRQKGTEEQVEQQRSAESSILSFLHSFAVY